MILSLLFILIPPKKSEAAIVHYPKKVQVSIFQSENLTMSVNGTYQLYNKDNGNIRVIPQGTTVSVKKDSTGITLSYTGFSEKSATGFNLDELTGTSQLAVFTQNTDLRRGATSSYEVIKTFKAGESANYVDAFTNAQGETWYKVASGSINGWVLSSTVTLSNVSSLSLTRLSNGITYRGSFYLKPNNSKVEVINSLDIEDYLKGVVPSEMPASWHKEALKAQAIVARSYAANTVMLSSTASSQVYRGYTGEDSRTSAAIKETEGQYVKYNGKPIQTFFFSTSGGRTANVSDVWNSDQKNFPYLVSVDDPYETSSYNNWTESFSASTILTSFGFSSSSTTLYDFSLIKSGANGEVKGVSIKTSAGDKTINGNESVVRRLFPLQSTAHYNILYSNWFSANVNKSAGSDLTVQTSGGTVPMTDLKGQTVQTANGQVTLSDSNVSIQTSNGVITNEGTGIDSVTITGKGWGHRVGMSQYGAKGFAEKGYTANQILTHYFQGTTVGTY
jgi:stage II sporulation protein D